MVMPQKKANQGTFEASNIRSRLVTFLLCRSDLPGILTYTYSSAVVLPTDLVNVQVHLQ